MTATSGMSNIVLVQPEPGIRVCRVVCSVVAPVK